MLLQRFTCPAVAAKLEGVRPTPALSAGTAANEEERPERFAPLAVRDAGVQEIFSVDELVQEFSLERINKAGARFDILKAQWYNQHYLRQKPFEELAEFLLASLAKENIECSKEKAIQIVTVMHDRVTFPQDFWEQGRYFFFALDSYDQAVVSKKWNVDAVNVLAAYRDLLESRTDFDSLMAKSTLDEAAAANGVGTGKILQAVRLVITGLGGGPDLMMIMEIIGKNEVIQRIDRALKTLQVKVS